MNKYMVVMAGGGGVRFWPLSRVCLPKQFLTLSGQDAMINETVTRAASLFSPGSTYIVTGKNQQAAMERVLLSDIPKQNILYEPEPKNTAPCILYAALHIQKKHGDGVMCVFSADHHITDTAAFLRVLNTAIQAAESGKAVTIGIKPTFPSIGYGYIKRGEKDGDTGAYQLDKFVEKPDADTARRYVDSGAYFWNSGMFVWKVSAVIDLYKRYLPDMYAVFMAEWDRFAAPDEECAVGALYPKLNSISVDYGIMEHVRDALVVSGDFGWSDIGSWDTLGDVVAPDALGNVVKGTFTGIDAGSNIIYAKDKLVTAVGVSNLIIIDTGDALLVCARDRAQEVKNLVDKLKENGFTQYL